jgi:hypothetical protein
LLTGVAVEKLGISEIRGNFGDRKCPAEQGESFVGHPDAIFFGGFLVSEFFNSHAWLHQLSASSLL